MILWILACTGVSMDGDAVGEPPAATANPFPNATLVEDGHVAIPEGLLPEFETSWDLARLNWREGFSPVQPSVAMLPVPIDPESLSGQVGLGTGGSVRLVDLDTGEEIVGFAELDAHPDALDSGERTLIVRPMEAMTPGHDVAVVLTGAVTTGGRPIEAADFPEWTARPEHADLVARLADLGFDAEIAWEFPVGDGTALTRHLAASVGVPPAYTIERVLSIEEGSELPDGVWKKIEGTFTTDDWLVDDTIFEIGADGLPVAQGTTEAYLYVHVPESVRDAAPGTVPVVVFGHGILAEPDDYLDSDDDTSAVIELSNRMGAIFVATKWRGLTADDQPEAVAVARDFARFPELTDKLTQGVANTLALIRLVDEGTLLADPELAGLADPSRLYWYGISLGAIEGSVTLANQTRIEHAVLHVGGSAWATMLERSSNWPVFELLVEGAFDDPWERQLLYATSQLLWDGVDPASYTEDLRGRTYLWQEAIGDNQVPNITTELFARSAGVPLGTPSKTEPLALQTVSLTTSAPALVQYDPELGEPDPVNRPPSDTGAHGQPRLWEGCIAQTAGFFVAGEEGTVAHYCGDGVCTASNRGE
ncbi:MAG: alpha/beta hydrolase family protein [Myxococcota bacterium]